MPHPATLSIHEDAVKRVIIVSEKVSVGDVDKKDMHTDSDYRETQRDFDSKIWYIQSQIM